MPAEPVELEPTCVAIGDLAGALPVCVGACAELHPATPRSATDDAASSKTTSAVLLPFMFKPFSHSSVRQSSFEDNRSSFSCYLTISML